MASPHLFRRWFNCSLPSNAPEPIKKALLDEPTNMERRAAQFLQRMNAGRVRLDNLAPDTLARKQRMIVDRLNQFGRMTAVAALDPRRLRNSINQMLARDFAISRQMFGLGDAYTQEGWVRQTFIRARRMAEGAAFRALAQLGSGEIIADAYRELQPLRRRLRISQNEWGYITSEAIELSLRNWVQTVYPIGEAGIRALNNQADRLTQRLTNLGASAEEIDLIWRSGSRAATEYERVFALAERAGVLAEGADDFISYMPRVMSQAALERFNWRFVDEGGNIIQFNDGTMSSMNQMLENSRSTNRYIVEDEAILDYVLRRVGESKGVDIYADLGVPDIRALLDDDRAISRLLIERLEPTTVGALIDSGIMSKLPMTTTQVYEYLLQSETLRMPFDSINQAFATDWRTGFQAYQQALIQSVGESGQVGALIRNAISGNWGVTEFERVSDMATYGKFVPLLNVIPEQVLEKFGYSQDLLNNPEVLRNLGLPEADAVRLSSLSHIYVHPAVADMFAATVNMSTSPHALGILSRTIDSLGTTYRYMATATSGFVFVQHINSAIQTVAAGGNLYLWADKVQKLWRGSFGRPGRLENLLDDTRLIGQSGLTERGLYRALQDRGVLGQFNRLLSNDQGTQYFARDPNFLRALRYEARTFQDIFTRYGWLQGTGRSLEHLIRLTESLVTDVGHPFRVANQIADEAGRFATVQTWLEEGNLLSHFGQFVSSGSTYRTTSIEEAIDKLQDYFYMYDDIGATNRMVSRYVIPFWNFQSKNLPAVMRHMIRHPARYMAYQRALSVLQSPEDMEQDEIINGAVPYWMEGTNPIFFRVPDMDGDGGEEWFAIPWNSYDPYSDAVTRVGQAGNDLFDALGVWTETTRPDTLEGQLEDVPWEDTHTNRTIESWLEGTYPVYRSAATLINPQIFQEYPLSFDVEESSTSLLGFEVSGMWRYLAETNLPFVANLNRWNPGNVFGLAPLYANDGTVIREGVPSWTGYQPQFQSDASQPEFTLTLGDVVAGNRESSESFILDVVPLSWLGFRGRYFDWYANVGGSLDDIRSSIQAGIQDVRFRRRSLPSNVSVEELNGDIEQIALRTQILYDLIYEYQLLNDWAEENGVPSRREYRQMQRQANALAGARSYEEYQVLFERAMNGEDLDTLIPPQFPINEEAP